MSNQPDEYYIEAVSNASMDFFPENTLTKFTNRLHHPINLEGEWVVAIHEIFYPVDVIIVNKDITLTLNTPHGQKRIKLTFGDYDGLEEVIETINQKLKEIYEESISIIPAKTVKRDTVDRSNWNIWNVIAMTNEQITSMSVSEYRNIILDVVARGEEEFRKLEEEKRKKDAEFQNGLLLKQIAM